MTTPFNVDLFIKQGATFRETFAWDIDGTPVNLEGVSARMQLRRAANSTGAPLADLTSAPGGGITIEEATGTVVVVIPHTVTSTLLDGVTVSSLTPHRAGVYDLELTWGNGDVTCLMSGNFHVTPEVTR